MKEKDMNIKENVIEMDMSKKKSEKHECANCGEEAIYYNTDTEKWICENCKNMEDELDKLAAKMEKKLSKRAYSFDIKELIECLSKDEIYNIARNLGVAKISGLNKDKLAEKLIGEYKPLIEKRINLFDEERYRLLMTYIDKKGVKLFDEVDEEEADKSAYFIQQGMLYPTVKDETSMFLMPKIVQKLIKDKNDIDYRRVLRANTELINIYRGMNKAYGVLKVEDAVNMLGKFNDNEDISLLDLLREASYYYSEFREESGYFINNEIDNYEEVLNDISKEEIKEYASIPKEELLIMSGDNWVYNSKAGKSFYKEFTSMFSVDKDMTIAMMEDLVLDVQELEPSEAVEKMIDLINIDNEDIRIVASKMMNKFVNKIRLWRLKGISKNDAKASSISEAASKVVGRNDPCICGSGKKYKKCCGKNGNVVQLPVK
ncbi:SEC-C metal-binding domain-containing protein [uncultured Clostridium sp.]|uniref:SEC-C metal-binding domain-containing protein n=1 Tax=uncultured Clostridium sp. TaxID=59620 RepID=UPI0025CD6EA1|nr:SEC-C metal-binding domain-containing protein [uncultured Clostridium sp.]